MVLKRDLMFLYWAGEMRLVLPPCGAHCQAQRPVPWRQTLEGWASWPFGLYPTPWVRMLVQGKRRLPWWGSLGSCQHFSWFLLFSYKQLAKSGNALPFSQHVQPKLVKRFQICLGNRAVPASLKPCGTKALLSINCKISEKQDKSHIRNLFFVKVLYRSRTNTCAQADVWGFTIIFQRAAWHRWDRVFRRAVQPQGCINGAWQCLLSTSEGRENPATKPPKMFKLTVSGQSGTSGPNGKVLIPIPPQSGQS